MGMGCARYYSDDKPVSQKDKNTDENSQQSR